MKMNSPEANTIQASCSHRMSTSKDAHINDDSGYVTVTPNSAECTAISDISGNASSSLCTPKEASPSRKSRLPKPKHLFNRECHKDLSSEQECKEPYLPTSNESSSSCLNKPSLKRQHAFDDIEWNCCVDKPVIISNSDPYDYLLSSSISYMQLHSGSSSSSNKEPIKIDEKYPGIGTSQETPASCPHTLVKYKKKIRKLSQDSISYECGNKTPENNESNFSPIFNDGMYLIERKSAKRLDFNSQKLGSPEKNQILYPQLKPVTPPKKISPEKLKKNVSESGSTKCRRSLFRHVDFLKLLGEQEHHLPALKCILSKLSCDDLSNVCQVSRTWRNVCQLVPEADKRRKKHMKEKEQMKENMMVTKVALNCKRGDTLPHNVNTVRCDLMEIQNRMNVMPVKVPSKPKSPAVSPGKRRFNMFIKAASEDSNGQLRKCPHCLLPARVQGRWAVCGTRGCGYSFCSSCLTERMPDPICCQRPLEAPSPTKQSQPKSYIGTKQSRRNLRRL